MKLPTIIQVGVIGVLLLVGLSAVIAYSGEHRVAVNSEAVPRSEATVHSKGHFLSRTQASDIVVTEFVDFQCPACRAAHHHFEATRAKYAKDVSFVTRHFPLPNHPRARGAAVAAEAAAEQGAFGAMYRKLFETDWALDPRSDRETFRDLASEMGLDVERFDRALASPAAAARVEADLDAAYRLGLRAVPTVYVNEQSVPLNEVDSAIERALGERHMSLPE